MRGFIKCIWTANNEPRCAASHLSLPAKVEAEE